MSSLAHSVDPVGLLEIAASAVGVLAGLTFAGAIQPLVIFFDRKREYEDLVATVADFLAGLASTLSFADVGSAAAIGRSRLRNLYWRKMETPAADAKFCVLLLSYFEAWRRTQRDGMLMDHEFRDWKSFTDLDVKLIKLDTQNSPLPGGTEFLSCIPDQALDTYVVNMRKATRNADVLTNLRRLSVGVLGISAILSAYSFLILYNALAHDKVCSDTHAVVRQVCVGALILIVLACCVALISQAALLRRRMAKSAVDHRSYVRTVCGYAGERLWKGALIDLTISAFYLATLFVIIFVAVGSRQDVFVDLNMTCSGT